MFSHLQESKPDPQVLEFLRRTQTQPAAQITQKELVMEQVEEESQLNPGLELSNLINEDIWQPSSAKRQPKQKVIKPPKPKAPKEPKPPKVPKTPKTLKQQIIPPEKGQMLKEPNVPKQQIIPAQKYQMEEQFQTEKLYLEQLEREKAYLKAKYGQGQQIIPPEWITNPIPIPQPPFEGNDFQQSLKGVQEKGQPIKQQYARKLIQNIQGPQQLQNHPKRQLQCNFCQAMVNYEDYQQHSNQCQADLYQEVGCVYCGESVIVRFLEDHFQYCLKKLELDIDKVHQSKRGEKILQFETNEEEICCIICFLSMCPTDRRYLPCCHVYHRACIDEWAKKTPKCPECQSNIEEVDMNKVIRDIQPKQKIIPQTTKVESLYSYFSKKNTMQPNSNIFELESESCGLSMSNQPNNDFQQYPSQDESGNE